MRAYERLVTYAKVMTPSDASSGKTPSSECQWNLARLLEQECKAIGLSDVHVSDKCYVLAKLPATPGLEDKTRLGLIAHMDTVSDYTEKQVTPVIHENYNGEDLILGTSGRALTVESFPHLPSLKGRTLITTDGNTVLGADDKAGIAEIMTLCDTLIKENIPHGPLSIAFTPDEEIGSGAEDLDLQDFDAEFGYTLDGGPEGEIEYENFNAAGARIHANGFAVHPGSSKDVMINAVAVLSDFHAMLPADETPRGTEGYEGFYHLNYLSGNVVAADSSYILRDHDKQKIEAKKANMERIAAELNAKYGEGTVQLTIRDQYSNMAEIIRPNFHLIENAQEAAKRAGLVPKIIPIRGGTDGARLSFRGLPCPNLGTGGYAFHGPYEHITAEGMDKVVEMLKELVQLYM